MVIIHLIWRCRQQTTKDLTMKLELPDNNASVLFHMGNALQSIARDIDTSLPVNGHTETTGDVSHSVTVEPSLEDILDNPPAATDELKELLSPHTEVVEYDEDVTSDDEPNDTIDADGLPWDSRIHSRGKTRLSDNTWRMARKPNDKSDEEWAEYVEGVKVELKALMDIPVVVEAPEVVTPPVVIEAPEVVTPPVVIEAPEVITHPFAIEPPVVDAPEVVTPPAVTGPTTFPELMKFITVNNKKLTKESVDEALKAQGLASIALLAARTDLIPQIHAALVKLL